MGIQGLFAEYERAMITERLRQGHRAHVQPPYGYCYIPVSQPGGGCWELDPVEAEVVRRIYRWYTEEALTITPIVDRLNGQGPLAPPRGQHWTFPGLSARTGSTVRGILKQPAPGQDRLHRSGLLQPHPDLPRSGGTAAPARPGVTPKPGPRTASSEGVD